MEKVGFSGYVKLHRKLTAWPLYRDGNTVRVFLHLLLTVAHTDVELEDGTVLRPGQAAVTQEKLAKELGLSRKQIRLTLEKLAGAKSVDIERAKGYSLVTVANWEIYQGGRKNRANKRATKRALEQEYIKNNTPYSPPKGPSRYRMEVDPETGDEVAVKYYEQ